MEFLHYGTIYGAQHVAIFKHQRFLTDAAASQKKKYPQKWYYWWCQTRPKKGVPDGDLG
jgi:hypothetical protein